MKGFHVGYLKVTENFGGHYPQEEFIFCQYKCMVGWFE